jgi:hypothetical protein
LSKLRHSTSVVSLVSASFVNSIRGISNLSTCYLPSSWFRFFSPLLILLLRRVRYIIPSA